MTAHRFAGAVITVVMLAGCNSARTGNPVPDASQQPRPSPTSSAPGTTQRLLPPRPRELDLTAVDPCTDVLTKDQLRQLAYDLGYQRRPLPGDVAIDNGRGCSYSSSDPTDQPSRDVGSLVIISTSAGAEKWLTDPARKSSADRSRKITVAGFPALVLPHPSFVDFCATVVDVHEGQYVEVQSSPSGKRDTAPDPYCAEAQRVADMIVRTLSARR